MTSNLNSLQTQSCQCDQIHQGDRRWFLRSFLSGFMLRVALSSGIVMPHLLTAQPAKAATHKAKALVLSCIDFRFVESERDFLSLQHLGNQYDWTALAGASLALAGFPHTVEAEAFWDQLALSRQLHQIETVIILDHQDCGAYASKVDPHLSQDAAREQQVHAEYLSRAYWEIRQRHSELSVELYFVTLKGEVRPISPKGKASTLNSTAV